MLKLLLALALVVVAVPAVLIGAPIATEDAAIPESCRQPEDVDYSEGGPTDFGPYAVKVTSWSHATAGLPPWETSAKAVVGHGLTERSAADYGVWLDLESTDLDAYTCTWTADGVTIIEPPLDEDGIGGQITHTIPAERFLGGR